MNIQLLVTSRTDVCRASDTNIMHWHTELGLVIVELSVLKRTTFSNGIAFRSTRVKSHEQFLVIRTHFEIHDLLFIKYSY